MSNDYYNNSSNTLTYGDLAKASDLESKFDDVVTGFAKLPDEAKLNRGTVDFVDDAGAANAYAVSMPQTASSLVDGMRVAMRVSAANTGAATLNVDSLGAKAIKKPNGDDLASGDLASGDIVELRYDSGNEYFIALSVTRDIAGLLSRVTTNENDITLLGDAELPGQTGNSGAYLTTDGSSSSWEALDDRLIDIAGQTPTDGGFIVGDGSNFGVESGATARASLSLDNVPNEDATDPQNWNPDKTDGNFLVGDGATFVAESGATARASLGLDNVPNEDATDMSNWDQKSAARNQAPKWSGSAWVPGAASGGVNTQLDQSADITLTNASDEVQFISFDGPGYTVTLPDATTLYDGMVCVLLNEGDYKYGVKDDGGNLINVVGKNTALHCYLVSSATSNGTWRFGPGAVDRILPKTTVTAFNSLTSSYPRIINLDDSTLIVIYQNDDNANDRGEAIAMDASDGSVLDGPLALNSVDTALISACKLSATEVFVCYDDLTNNDLEGVVLEYSGGTLSIAGGPTQIDSNNPVHFGCCTLDSSNVGVAFTEGTNTDLRAAVVNWNGTDTISVSGGPTQISSDNHDYMECLAIDATNWLCVAEDNTSDDLFAYSINWDDGTSTISQNGSAIEIADGATAIYMPQIVQLEDDGTYLWIAVVYRNNENDHNEADIEVFTVTKADATLTDSISILIATDFTVRPIYQRYCAFVIGSYLYFLSRNYDEEPNSCWITQYEWDSSTPSLIKIAEEKLTPTAAFHSGSAALVDTNKVIAVFYDGENNDYGSYLKLEIVE